MRGISSLLLVACGEYGVAMFERQDALHRHCEERGDEAIHSSAEGWVASRSLTSGAHSRDPLARNDGMSIGRLLPDRTDDSK
jgi:hypothetical protein